MKKLLIIMCLASLTCTSLYGQSVESKRCKTCGKPLKECQYKGKHPNRTSAPKPSKPKIESKYLRMDGNDIVFDLNGEEHRYKMVYVQGGTFSMGNTWDGFHLGEGFGDAKCSGWEEEKPVHSESVKDFYLGQTEVTQELWMAVMGNNPSHFRGKLLPVEGTSYKSVKTFINKLSALTGLAFRLPSEEEWEYAARGGINNTNQAFSGCHSIYSLEKYAWYGENSDDNTHMVATKQPNELGLYDMCGNVKERCSNCWRKNYQSDEDCSSFVCRGGNCKDSWRDVFVSARIISQSRGPIGFRLALSK